MNDTTPVNESTGPSRQDRAITFAAFVLAVATLYFGREMLIPLFVSAFLAFLLIPAMSFFERRIRRMPAVIVVVSLGLGAIGGVGWIVIAQAAALASDIPMYRDDLISRVRELRARTEGGTQRAAQAIREIGEALDSPAATSEPTPAADKGAGDDDFAAPTTLPLPPDTASSEAESSGDTPTETPVPAPQDAVPVPVQVVPSRPDILRNVGVLVAPVVHPLATAGISLVFVIFFLYYHDDLRERFLRISGHARIEVTTTALAESASRVTRYLSSLALVNLFTGMAIAIGLFIIGIPNALLWGLLAALLRFVPFLGPWIAALFPLAISIAISDGWTQPLLVAGMYLLVEAVCVNLLEPWFYGARMAVSPVAVLISFMFWTWMWGAVGLIMAMPITVCLVVLGKHIPVFEFFYLLLGDEPVSTPSLRLYRRMVAMDRDEALQLCRESLEQESFVDSCDTVILPALAQMERDSEDHVGRRRAEFIKQTIRELIHEIAATRTKPDDDAGAPTVRRRLLVVTMDGALAPVVAELVEESLAPMMEVEHMEKADLMSKLTAIAHKNVFDAIVLVTVEPRTLRDLKHVCRTLAVGSTPCPVIVLWVGTGVARAKHARALLRQGGQVRVLPSVARIVDVVGRGSVERDPA